MEGNKKETRRLRARQQRQAQQLRSRIFSIGIGLAVIAAMYFWLNRPKVGLEVEPMESAEHVPVGTEIEYTSSPPTSGPHYDQPMPAGFYDENSPEAALPFPHQFVLHAMEHGYVVIWYNCAAYDGPCDDLKTDIRAVLEESPAKVIAFPWADMEEPVVLTSWAWMERLTAFDADAIRGYIRDNRSHPRAPEYNVP
ncbi:MAG: DUF3105 domain-containing protein [Anaerolineae bacterium]|nr:MAG: DUF3105 domain-containing protein [Anaerolineae bacterium]